MGLAPGGPLPLEASLERRAASSLTSVLGRTTPLRCRRDPRATARTAISTLVPPLQRWERRAVGRLPPSLLATTLRPMLAPGGPLPLEASLERRAASSLTSVLGRTTPLRCRRDPRATARTA